MERGDQVVGIANLNGYYDVKLKHARLDLLKGQSGFIFEVCDIADNQALSEIFNQYKSEVVMNLAA